MLAIKPRVVLSRLSVNCLLCCVRGGVPYRTGRVQTDCRQDLRVSTDRCQLAYNFDSF